MSIRKYRGSVINLIEVNHLVKQYGTFRAVNDLSFTVEPGQIYGFLGPNGAGKSTTMNIMTGYLSATSGTVRIAGHEMLLEPEEAKRHIGYLPEIPPVYPDMTPREYLRFAGELKGVARGKLEAEVERVMELTGITSMHRRLIGNLSKGYRQRVGVSCALLGDPEVIILDEPTVGLDPRQILDIRDLIRSLGGDHTVILSSHILSEVSAVCDHVLILSGGKLVAQGTPAELERLMRWSNRYHMLVQGTPEAVSAALLAAQKLGTVEVQPDSSGFVGVTMETEEGTDPRAELFRLLAGADLPIMELTSSHASLEDVFLELTGEQTAEEKESGEQA